MTERQGVYSLLENSFVYQTFQRIMKRPNFAFEVRQRLFPEVTEGPIAILDAGCGPASFLSHHWGALHVDGLTYVGFDPNPAYIKRAREQFPDKVFHTGTTETLNEEISGSFELAVSLGVIHHINDADAVALSEFIHRRLVPGGRFVTFDPVFLPNQRPIARFLASSDRGRFVRSTDDYINLVAGTFGESNTNSALIHDLYRPPYDILAITATRQTG